MGIDVEDVKLCVCRIAHFSLRVSYRFVQKHPYVSGALSFLFVLYIFLPSVLRILFYSLPFVGFSVILLAFWTSKSSTNRGEKREDKSESSENGAQVNSNRGRHLRNATSRRQRFKEKSEPWNAETIDVSVSRINKPVEYDNSKAFVDLSDRGTSIDKNIEISGQIHQILGSEVPVKSDSLGCGYSSSQTNKSDSGGDETKNESSEEAEDEDEEETQEDRNKAVEWTEDDQKNLMDMGLSEIERNRRLESLIARRRARKSYKRKVEGAPLTIGVIPIGQIPKIVTTKNDPFAQVPDSLKETDGVPIPGSAPSILLPMRNPFDLPYDPLEEKPNLMADSFQEEFTAAHQKELSFCRHESFCLGPAFPLGDEGGKMGYPRFRRPSDTGDHDWLIEQLLCKGDQASNAEKKQTVVEIGGESSIEAVDSSQMKDDKGTETMSSMTDNEMKMKNAQGKKILPDTESEFETEPPLIQDRIDESSPSTSSENPEDVSSTNGVVVSHSLGSTSSNTLDKSLKCIVPKIKLTNEPLSDFSPSAFEKNKTEDCLPYPDKVACHTPTYSIASDLQVEVSEMGSPSLTVDGNNSLTDGDSFHRDWEIEKELNSGGEELWRTSSDPLGVRERELKSKDPHEANGENIGNVKLPGIDMNSENLVSSELVQDRHEQDDLNSLPDEVSNKIVSNPQVNLTGEIEASSASDAASKTIQPATQLTKELVEQPPQYVLPHEPKELSSPPVDNERAINVVIEQKDADTDAHALGNMKNMIRTSEEIDDGWEILMKQGNDGKNTGIWEETDLECKKSFNDDFEDSSRYRTDLHHLQLQEGGNILNQNAAENGDLEEPCAYSNNKEGLMLSETKEQLEYIEDNKNGINVLEGEFQNFNDVLRPTLEQDSVIVEAPLDSSPRLSPMSVLEEQIHMDKFSSSTFDDAVPVDASECLVEDKENSSPSTKPDLPLTVQELEDNATEPATTSNADELQESSQTLETHEEDVDTINNLKESIIDGTTNGENSEYGETTKRESEISITNEDDIISSVKHIEESILSDSEAKVNEKDDNRPVDSIETESEIIGDLSERNGDKTNLDAKGDNENTDHNSSTPMPALDTDTNISENITEREVATKPLMESQVTRDQIEIEQTPITVATKNSQSVENCEVDRDVEGSSVDIEQTSTAVINKNIQSVEKCELDREMTDNSIDLNETERLVSPSKQKGEISDSKLLKDKEEEGNVIGQGNSGLK